MTLIARRVFKLFFVLLTVLLILLVLFYFWASSGIRSGDKLFWIEQYREPGLKASGEPLGSFRVMTYNIGYLSAMANNRPVLREKKFFRGNLNRVVSFLKENPIDFVALQEIDFDSHRSYYIDQLKTIASGSAYPFAAGAVNWNRRYVPFPFGPPAVHFGRMLSGQGVLSRWPVLSVERVVLEKVHNRPFYWRAFYLDRLAQVVQARISGRILVLINVHLEAFDRETREIQAREVLNLYRSQGTGRPVLILGDFNCVPPGTAKKSGFHDEPETDYSRETTIEMFLSEQSLKPVLLKSPTFPTGNPDRKLDYIFYTHDSITLLRAYVADLPSSDHLPLVMEFKFNK